MAQEGKPRTRTRAARRENVGPYDPATEGQPKGPYQSQAAANDEGLVRTYEAGRILDIGDNKRWPGELVPEAHTFFRLQNLVHTGYVKSVEVSKADFNEAVQKYCPELAEEINQRVDSKENK